MDADGQSGLTARFGEASKLLPVSAVLSTVAVLYVTYVFLHCMRLLQLDLPAELRKQSDVDRGTNEIIVFHVVTGMVLYCMARCILTYPGNVPDGKGWELRADAEDNAEGGDGEKRGIDLVEKKHTGERRHCKWCLKYKPDRCHHCRICNVCVLRMDHHCPWVYNCIGFRNHKYFFLLLVYAVIDLIVVTVTMFDTVWWSTRIDVSLAMMSGLMLAETLASFLMVLLVIFLCFHIWLMAKAMTTVEFCEKSLKKSSYNSSVYCQGFYYNACAILGPRPMLWLLPISLPEGDGLTWPPPKGQGDPHGKLKGQGDPHGKPKSQGASRGSGRKSSGPDEPLITQDAPAVSARRQVSKDADAPQELSMTAAVEEGAATPLAASPPQKRQSEREGAATLPPAIPQKRQSESIPSTTAASVESIQPQVAG
jgi:hypothetical protein